MENCAIYLIGFQGIGKLTIAKELCKLGDFRLIDNHSINNLVFSLVRRDGKDPLPPEVWPITRRIREIVLETLADLGKPEFNFIFTNALYEEDANDRAVYESVRSAIDKRNGCFIPVRLLCDPEEHKQRITSPSRELLYKQTDVSIVEPLHADKQPMLSMHDHAFSLNITNLTPQEAAAQIMSEVQRIYANWTD